MSTDATRSASASSVKPSSSGTVISVPLSRPAARATERAVPRLFQGVSWGSAAVLEQTLARAAAAGLSTALLERLADIDRPEDLPVWERRRDRPPAGLRLSVVIPAIDEQEHIAATVACALEGGAAEVVVADGGSTDGTRELAARAGALVIEAPRGRARQMNAGALHASGDALLFLHADTRPPPGFAAPVRTARSMRLRFVCSSLTNSTVSTR